MEIHSYLLDIIKLIITIALGILSLSIGFIDKLSIDLKDKAVRKTVTTLWVTLIIAIIFAIVTSFCIYLDVEYFKKVQILAETIKLNENEIRKFAEEAIKSKDLDTNQIIHNFQLLKEPDLKRSWETKTSFILTILPFLISIIQLIRIGFLTIKQKTRELDAVEEVVAKDDDNPGDK